jgi:hypothetical protein
MAARTVTLCSCRRSAHFRSPSRASIFVESTMSLKTKVASTRSPSASGDNAKLCALVNSTEVHGSSPSTHASWPGGIS